MSWLGALAAKTENLLNKVDQAAGHALQNTGFEQTDSSSHHSTQWQFSKGAQDTSLNYSPFLSQKNEKQLILCQQSPTVILSKLHKKDEDSELLELLNDPKSFSTKESTSLDAFTQGNTTEQILPSVSQKESNYGSQTILEGGKLPILQATPSLTEENQLLKNEIQSLNREMQSMIARVQINQEELNRAHMELHKQSKQLLRSEQDVRELRERESDLMTAIQAKDAQSSVFRVKLEEADHDLVLQKKKVTQLLSDKDRILQDHSLSTGVQSHALETLQERVQDAEAALRREQGNFQKQESELKNKLSQLELEKENVHVEISNLQRSLSKEKVNTSDINNQLKSAKAQAETARQELVHYKDKAARILQSKDRLIATLKEGSLNNIDGSGASEPMVHSSELDGLRQERDILREDYHSSQLALENMRADISELENQMQQESESVTEQIRLLDEQIDTEKRRREDAEAEIIKHKEELKLIHEEVFRQKSAFQMRLQDREAEIQRLRNQLTTKSLNASSQEELENRLHTLTESLIQKQTALESLSTEKSSLFLQLERMEKQYREAESSAMRNSSSAVHLTGDDDDVRPRFSSFTKESPLDGNVARKVKMAANTIDKFSIRLGMFLRRYPMARMFIIAYMFFLHIWVMVVLLTYQPGIHTT